MSFLPLCLAALPTQEIPDLVSLFQRMDWIWTVSSWTDRGTCGFCLAGRHSHSVIGSQRLTLKHKHIAIHTHTHRAMPSIARLTISSADADKPTRCIYRSVKVTKHGTTRYVSYGLLLVCRSNFVPKSFWDIWLYSDLETRVMGHSRSSEPTCIDPTPMTSY